MKKLIETSLGHWDTTWFSLDGRRISDEEALELIKKEANPYNTNDNKGIIVYLSPKEYEALKKQKK